MALIVTGYVDGEPVYFEEPEPTKYEATAEVEDKPSYGVEINAEDEFSNLTSVYRVLYISGEWIEPVWQRTAADVAYANILNNKISESGWTSLTAQEQTDWTTGLIGCLNYWDLNRIEIDTEILAGILTDYGYYVSTLTIKKDWSMDSFPYNTELERVRLNIGALISSYYTPAVALPTTLEKPTYQTINDIESILKLMKEMLILMAESFRYSGTMYCGQEVVF